MTPKTGMGYAWDIGYCDGVCTRITAVIFYYPYASPYVAHPIHCRYWCRGALQKPVAVPMNPVPPSTVSIQMTIDDMGVLDLHMDKWMGVRGLVSATGF